MSINDDIQRVLSSPGCSRWLSDALRSAQERDPVDAANDAEVLSDLLARRCEQMLSGTSL